MHRIGHKYYYIQGGDFGHAIGSNMATIFQYEVLGFHTNLPVNFAKNAAWTWLLGSIWPSYTAGEHIDKWYPLGAKIKYYFEEFGYMHLQSTKPDTIGKNFLPHLTITWTELSLVVFPDQYGL